MKRTFYLGKIDFENTGIKKNLVTVEMEYEEKNSKPVFSVSADVWDRYHYDIICGGQCLDTIAPYINDPVYSEIFRLWKLYHLNDMHPECEHQADRGWREIAKEKVPIYTFGLTRWTLKEYHRIKENVLDGARSGKGYDLTDEERLILNSKYSVKTYLDHLPEKLAPFYELKDTEYKALGFLEESNHPRGILRKPCPVCGYKYGTSWNYFPIPKEDEEIILRLLKTGGLE